MSTDDLGDLVTETMYVTYQDFESSLTKLDCRARRSCCYDHSPPHHSTDHCACDNEYESGHYDYKASYYNRRSAHNDDVCLPFSVLEGLIANASPVAAVCVS